MRPAKGVCGMRLNIIQVCDILESEIAMMIHRVHCVPDVFRVYFDSAVDDFFVVADCEGYLPSCDRLVGTYDGGVPVATVAADWFRRA